MDAAKKNRIHIFGYQTINFEKIRRQKFKKNFHT